MTAWDDPDFGWDPDGIAHALDALRKRLHDPPAPAPAGGAPALPLPRTLPERGIGPRAALGALAPASLDGAVALGAPGFLAHMDPPAPWVAWTAVAWAAALNQNALHPETGPVARALERRAVSWLAPAFGMDGGHLVPGSTLANLTALWAARELHGIYEVVASEAAHVSVFKAARLLGLRYRAVPVDDAQRLRPERLGDLSRAALVLTAGTTATGAIDPLDAGTTAAWRHVDAAWAGPLRLSARHRELLDGIEAADSVAVSAHKWLFQPKGSALVLFRRTEPAHAAITVHGSYLAAPNVGVLGSRADLALPLVATLLAWGREGLARRIERCMRIAAELAQRIRAHDELELWRPPETGVVLWRARGVDAGLLRDRLDGAFCSLLVQDGERWLRSVAANPLADPQLLVERALSARAALRAR